MKLIDTHCHLDFDDFAPDRDAVVYQARQAGVSAMIVPGVKAASWSNLVMIADQYACRYAIGLHPCFIHAHVENDLQVLEAQLTALQPSAVGEIGLDFYNGNSDKDRQMHFFQAQVEIAQSNNLPIIVHARKSHDQVLQVLKTTAFSRGGIIHAFNGSFQQASRYLDSGFKLGFGGMLTYERSKHLRQLAASLPLESMVTETDAPDMTGAKHHGQRNSPAYIPEIVEALALIRNQHRELIAEQVWINAKALFGDLSGNRV